LAAHQPGKMSAAGRKQKLLVALFIVAFMVVLLRSARLSDDAYITFRTVDNFINGYGLTWNAGERVQAFTHPLWMFFLPAFYFVSGEIYYTSIFLSCSIALCGLCLFAYGIAGSTRAALLGACLLTFSRAFVDYSTSGLENPLTHLLLLSFLLIYLKFKANARTLLVLSLIAALGMLNRMDTALLYLPVYFCGYLPVFSWLGLPGLSVPETISWGTDGLLSTRLGNRFFCTQTSRSTFLSIRRSIGFSYGQARAPGRRLTSCCTVFFFRLSSWPAGKWPACS